MPVSPLGREIDRVDGRSKVTGAAQYAADYPVADVAYAYVVTSTIAKGRILAMDTAAAVAAPGVRAVFHPDRNLGFRPPRAGSPALMVENYLPLQDREVRYYGQAVAMVVAETFEQARDAAALITTTYESAPPRISLEAHSPGVQPPLPPNMGPANVTVLAPGVDSIDAALAASDVRVEATFHQPVQHHVAMEPHASVARWNEARTEVTVWTGSQSPMIAAQLLADRLHLPLEAVRVICTYTGGGFGSRVRSWNDSILAVGAAYQLGRPVKVVMTREQVFTMVGHRGQINHTVRLGASRAGVLQAVSHESDAELPAVGGWPMLPATDTTDTLYRTPNLHVRQRFVTLDMPPSWAMRGPNEAPGAFALETLMDEIAVRTGVDPVEVRLRNYAAVSPSTGKTFSSKHLEECYRVGARRFGWSARRAEPRSRTDGEWLIGMGMATAIYPGNRMPVNASVELRDDDTAVVSTATSDIGTGALTVLAIVGADQLGIPMRKVTPRLGDSWLPPGATAAGSAATSSTVPSVVAAAEGAIAELRRLAVSEPASPWHGADLADVTYAEGRLSGAGRSMTFGRLLAVLGRKSLVVDRQTALAPEMIAQYEFHSFGAHFCEVRVNRFTGEPRVTRFTTVVDAGRVVNAQAARSQIVGGVIFGIGQALLEKNPVETGTGRLAASNMADYMVPVNADVPDIDVHLLREPDPHVGALGTRGLGELGAVGSAAAIGNAVYNATGIRRYDLPITLDKLLP
ncbi:MULTISPECIES: xanthine dehydrogenase family protein molybdopterin-binding subunit [Catenuloplanes]|uniref:Xanthine dehydrogenase YagR molybdenum-binding subunit n=1 Tax=Catenuloplanes niger TaxID=587534 RepID=A0AAE4CQ81_9ACTN|nr:xanthine dehydrogenase family protein molybdopterin-binding subunit [Catenuloplanes niger]MDR7320650.1 xanthine dehydrogenase YagR molybdenum-binding subunit [Catenuloplanes niger]